MTASQARRYAEDLAASVRSGDRRALARAITIVESTKDADRLIAERLLTVLLAATGGAVRIGISGAPGAGKSSFIEAIGEHAARNGARLAVLAVDPSSQRSGGSILGDKTRMARLSRNPDVFIRPTASGGLSGGVARRTREAILLVEAAGFDVVLVETVGIGQSETTVAEMVDLFVLLVSPAGGDDLQGIKRGVMELADLVVITKDDGDLGEAAARAYADFRAALSLLRPKFAEMPPSIVKASSLTGAGIGDTWNLLGELHGLLRKTGRLTQLREVQLRAWFWNEIRTALAEFLESHPAVAAQVAQLEKAVLSGQALPEAAARRLIGAVRGLDGLKTGP